MGVSLSYEPPRRQGTMKVRNTNSGRPLLSLEFILGVALGGHPIRCIRELSLKGRPTRGGLGVPPLQSLLCGSWRLWRLCVLAVKSF